MRAIYVVAACLGCLPTRIATPAPESAPMPAVFNVAPMVVPVAGARPDVISRAAQYAMTLGLSPIEMNPDGGLIRVQSIRLDEWATERLHEDRQEALERKYGASTAATVRASLDQHRIDVVRRLTITAVVGAGTATVSPSVTSCLRSSSGTKEQCSLESDAILEAQELQQFEAFVRGLEAARREQAPVVSPDAAKI